MVLWTVVFLMIGGVAVDSAKAWRMQAMLQTAADAAAHAAVIRMERGADLRAVARTYAEKNMPPDSFGETYRDVDVTLGQTDVNTGVFFVGAEPPNTVQVTLRRAESNGNAETTTFLRLVGWDFWNVSATAIAQGFFGYEDRDPEPHPCWDNGMAARGIVGMTSNSIMNGVCVYGGEGVAMNNNNEWNDGTVVAMPDLALLNEGRHVDFGKNEGLAEALERNVYDPYPVDYVRVLLQDHADDADIVVDAADFGAAHLQTGLSTYVHCAAKGRITLPGIVMREVTLITNCDIKFGQDAVVLNSIIGTSGDAGEPDTIVPRGFAEVAAAGGAGVRAAEALGLVAHAKKGGNGNGNGGGNGNGNGGASDGGDAPGDGGTPDDQAPTGSGAGFVGWGPDDYVPPAFPPNEDDNGPATVQGASGVEFGGDDNCVQGGGSLMLVDGTVSIAGKMGVFGSTVVATQSVSFAAQSLGVEGSSILSGGSIDNPAQQWMFGCPTGTDWRMARKRAYRFTWSGGD